MRTTLRARVRAVATAAALAAGLAIPAIAAAGAAPAANAAPATGTVQVPTYNHIAVIMFTDHGFNNIVHNKYASTFTKLGNEYGLATRYYTTSDPDTAGIMALLAGNDFGVNDGSPWWDQPVTQPSLLSQLDAAHKTWNEYVQDIPYAGYLGECYPIYCEESDSLYKQEKFNPVPDFTGVSGNPAEADKMVPAADLERDAHAGTLPNFSFIDANECTNMHGGPPWCEDSPNNLGQRNDNKLVAGGNAYLKQVTSAIMSGPQWKQGNNAIVITETEGTTNAGCCDAKPGTGRVYTVVVTSHGPRHLTDFTPFNHYSLLSTIQHAFGLGCLQFTCDTANVIPMAKLFGASSDGPITFPGEKPETAAQIRRADARLPHARPAAAKPDAAKPTSPWTVVKSPDTGANDNDLWSISGRSPRNIWAVGSLLPNANATIVQTLAVHYNGKKWSRVPTPDFGGEANSLYGVAALPNGTAWATGIYTQASGHTGHALTMHWNGHKWKIVRAANPGSAEDMLYSVTAVNNRDVWAVGSYGEPTGFFRPLIEHWNGKRWSAVGIHGLRGANGELTEVSSASGGGVWATGHITVGQSDRQVLLHLVHGHWAVAPGHVVHTPGGAIADAYPMAVAASAHGAWVAGNDRAGHSGYSTFVEAPAGGGSLTQFNTADPTPNDNYLQGIAPVNGGKDAWAVGNDVPISTGNAQSLIVYGSATGGWVVVPSPDPSTGGNNILDGIQAFGTHNIWAVGEFDGNGGMRTLIIHYTGGKI
jgi:hypothetical protein